MSQNRKLTSLVSVVGLFALTGVLVAACGDDGGDGGGGSCAEIGARVEGLTASADALGDLAATIKVDVVGACARIANVDAPATPTDAQVTEICNQAKARLDANITASVDVVIVPPICTVNANAQFMCEADCYAAAEVTCDPGTVEVRCEPGDLSVTCSGSCNVNAYCEGSANVAVNCEGSCEGTCEGTCDGTCEGSTASGGNCNGACDGTCEGTCRGSCKIEAQGGIECGAQAKCRGGCSVAGTAPSCTGNLEPPSCEAMAEVDCSADCTGSASLKAECTDPSVRIVGIADADIRGDFEAALPVIIEVAKKGELALSTVGKIGTDVVAVSGRIPGCTLDLGASIAGEFAAVVSATATASASVSVSFQASASVSGSASGG